MIEFQFLDWLWLVLFIILMVFFGAYFYRLGKRSQSDFFLAGPSKFQYVLIFRLDPDALPFEREVTELAPEPDWKSFWLEQ